MIIVYVLALCLGLITLFLGLCILVYGNWDAFSGCAPGLMFVLGCVGLIILFGAVLIFYGAYALFSHFLL